MSDPSNIPRAVHGVAIADDVAFLQQIMRSIPEEVVEIVRDETICGKYRFQIGHDHMMANQLAVFAMVYDRAVYISTEHELWV